jgi:membrane protein YqaA with SNARE-associated domain
LAVIVFAIYGIAVESPFVYYYIPITVVLAALVGLIHRTARFSDATLMALTLAAIGNLAGGVLLWGEGTLYGAALVGDIRYDKVFHALATGVAGWAAYEAVRRWGIAGTGAAVFVSIMVAGGAGAFVEIIEYVGSLLFENTSVGDYGNNMLDLIANTLGSIAGVTLATRFIDEPGPA